MAASRIMITAVVLLEKWFRTKCDASVALRTKYVYLAYVFLLHTVYLTFSLIRSSPDV